MDRQFLEFKSEDLITVEGFKSIMDASLEGDIISIICAKLRKYVIVKIGMSEFSKVIYALTKTFYYKQMSQLVILTYIVNYIEDSIRALPAEVKKLFLLNYPKKFVRCSHRNTIKKYLDGIMNGLDNDSVQFDTVISELHFQNGYIDIKIKEFKKREFGSHYVKSVIERDYVPSSERQREFVISMISKILPEKSDRDAVLQTYGGCLSGKITKEKKIFWFVGKGSAGKTTLNDLTQFAFTVYTVELKPDTFCSNSNDQSKVLNTFRDRPNIYFSFINEMSDSRLDCKTLKNFAEGKVSVTELYKDKMVPIVHKSMLFIAMNDLPNMVIDTGMKRRIWALYLKSLFVDNKKHVDESKHIYLKDKDFQETMTPYLDAWVDILVEYSHNYINGAKIKVTKHMKEVSESLSQNNDVFQDFIDGYLIVEPNGNFRIGKHRMCAFFRETFPGKKLLTDTQILSSLKDKGLDCDYTKKSNNIRGWFMGISIKPKVIDKTDEEDDPYEKGVDKKEQSVSVELVKLQSMKIHELEKKLKEAEKKLNSQKSEEPESSSEDQKEVVEQVIMNTSVKEVEDFERYPDNFLDDDVVYVPPVKKNQKITEKKTKTVKKAKEVEKDTDDESSNTIIKKKKVKDIQSKKSKKLIKYFN